MGTNIQTHTLRLPCATAPTEPASVATTVVCDTDVLIAADGDAHALIGLVLLLWQEVEKETTT